MHELQDLLSVADAFQRATGLKDTTISSRLFGDGKKLPAIRCGDADITITRFNAALVWFSAHWPNDAEWPDDVFRPVVEVAA